MLQDLICTVYIFWKCESNFRGFSSPASFFSNFEFWILLMKQKVEFSFGIWNFLLLGKRELKILWRCKVIEGQNLKAARKLSLKFADRVSLTARPEFHAASRFRFLSLFYYSIFNKNVLKLKNYLYLTYFQLIEIKIDSKTVCDVRAFTFSHF